MVEKSTEIFIVRLKIVQMIVDSFVVKERFAYQTVGWQIFAEKKINNKIPNVGVGRRVRRGRSSACAK